MWGKIAFAVLMFLGILASFGARNYNLALFFAIVLAVMIWIIRTRPKADMELRR